MTAAKVNFRNSVDGKFVKEDYAKKHPRETEREVVKPAKPAPPAPKKRR